MRLPALLAVIIALLFTGCATTGKQPPAAEIGPYTAFAGRLIVIDAARRWQVMVDWNGTPEQGALRLTHAASNRIIRIRWHYDDIQMLDNLDRTQSWRSISVPELYSHGVILPPQQLSRILMGEIPGTLTRKNLGEWEGRLNGTFIRIRWLSGNQRLELTDITHGRKAILMIQS